MFKKQTLLLPMVAVVVLVLLYLFQEQQLKKAETLRAEAKAAMPLLVKFVDDPLEKKPKGDPARCVADKTEVGVEYPLSVNIEAGRISVDLTRFHQSLGDDMLLFAIIDGKTDPCMPALVRESPLCLCFNVKNDSLVLSSGAGRAASRLDPGLALPFRLQAEWHHGKAELFVNGTRAAELPFAARPEKAEKRLVLGQIAGGVEKTGAEFRALTVSLMP